MDTTKYFYLEERWFFLLLFLLVCLVRGIFHGAQTSPTNCHVVKNSRSHGGAVILKRIYRQRLPLGGRELYAQAGMCGRDTLKTEGSDVSGPVGAGRQGKVSEYSIV